MMTAPTRFCSESKRLEVRYSPKGIKSLILKRVSNGTFTAWLLRNPLSTSPVLSTGANIQPFFLCCI